MFHSKAFWWYIFIFAQDVYTLLHIFATVRIMIPWNFSFKITIEENPVKYLQTFMQSIYFATHVSTFSDNSDGKERSLKYFWTEWDLEEICFCQTMCSRPLVIAYWCQVNIFLLFSSLINSRWWLIQNINQNEFKGQIKVPGSDHQPLRAFWNREDSGQVVGKYSSGGGVDFFIKGLWKKICVNGFLSAFALVLAAASIPPHWPLI